MAMGRIEELEAALKFEQGQKWKAREQRDEQAKLVKELRDRLNKK